MNIDYLKKRENPIIFDKNNEFIYFPVNKVMQTTIARNYLKDRCIIYKDNPKLWNEYFKKTDFNTIYKFGIIRNPIHKFESSFNYLKKQNKLSKRLKIDNIDINTFVQKVIVNYDNPFLFNPHFEKQYEAFYYNDTLLVDELFKIENEDDLNKLFQKLNIKNDIHQKFNETIHKSILNEKSKNILKKIYKNDLIHFKYN